MAISARPGNVCRVLNERNIYSISPEDMAVSHWIFIDLEWYCIRIYECITLNFYWSGTRSGAYDHVRGGQQINQKICHFLFYFSWILDERNLVSSLAIQINQFKKASIKRRFECSPSNEQWQFFTQEQPLKNAVCSYFFCLFNDYSSQQKVPFDFGAGLNLHRASVLSTENRTK